MKRKLCTVMAVLALLNLCSCNKDNTNNIIVYNDENTNIIETTMTSQKEVVAEFDDFSSENINAFKDKMSEEDFMAAEDFFSVINDEKEFCMHVHNDVTENMYFSQLRERWFLIRLERFILFDIDNDNEKELIMQFDNADMYAVLNKENDEFFINMRSPREMQFLQKNGIFGSSGGAACTHYNTLSFENGKYVENEIAYHCVYEDYMFCINGKEVSEEEFEAWREEMLVGEVQWYT